MENEIVLYRKSHSHKMKKIIYKYIHIFISITALCGYLLFVYIYVIHFIEFLKLILFLVVHYLDLFFLSLLLLFKVCVDKFIVGFCFCSFFSYFCRKLVKFPLTSLSNFFSSMSALLVTQFWKKFFILTVPNCQQFC